MTSRTVTATISFLGPCTGKPIYYGHRHERDNLPLESRVVTIEDLRSGGTVPSLEGEGFALLPAVASPDWAVARFGAQREAYLREVEAVVQQATGALKVVAFTNGVVRRSERSPGFLKDNTTLPGRFAHCDFSPGAAGSRYWVEQLLPADEAKVRLQRRFALFNVWRVLSDPPQDTPLALCDARTFEPADLVPSDCVSDSPGMAETRIENSVLRYSPRQRWCYFSAMTRDEWLIFKGYDSDPQATGAVPHAAFDDPDCPSGAVPRESVDDRVIAFF